MCEGLLGPIRYYSSLRPFFLHVCTDAGLWHLVHSIPLKTRRSARWSQTKHFLGSSVDYSVHFLLRDDDHVPCTHRVHEPWGDASKLWEAPWRELAKRVLQLDTLKRVTLRGVDCQEKNTQRLALQGIDPWVWKGYAQIKRESKLTARLQTLSARIQGSQNRSIKLYRGRVIKS